MNPRPTLAASVAGAVVVALDGTVLTLAQPALQRELGASHAQVQWTSTAYLVAVASLLAAVRRRSDVMGARVAMAGSIVVIAAGTYWFVQRVFFV